jgi:hypothetical protein
MKNKLMIIVVMATVICANMLFAANLVNNGTFELPDLGDTPGAHNNGGPIDDWRITSTGGGVVYPAATLPLPMTGQAMWFNNAGPAVYQTFVGTKLLPSMTYILKFDARAEVAPQTVNVRIQHCTGSGTNSGNHSGLVTNDVTDIVVSNGTWLAGWVGVRFDVQLASNDYDSVIYHEFRFTTPATLSDPNADVDLGISFSGASGVQVQVDNVSVEVIPEPATIGLLSLLGFAFLRRK